MHFLCFKEKHCTLIVFHNRIFPKNWGGGPIALLAPPIRSLGGGGHGPPGPPVADPMVCTSVKCMCEVLVELFEFVSHFRDRQPFVALNSAPCGKCWQLFEQRLCNSRNL